MKNQLLTAIIIAMVFGQLMVSKAGAQTRKDCVPENGYWVLVTNAHEKAVTTVQFYNTDNQLIYQEDIRGQRVNLNRVKTLRCLKKGLDSALIAWNLQKQALYNKTWVAVNLKH